VLPTLQVSPAEVLQVAMCLVEDTNGGESGKKSSRRWMLCGHWPTEHRCAFCPMTRSECRSVIHHAGFESFQSFLVRRVESLMTSFGGRNQLQKSQYTFPRSCVCRRSCGRRSQVAPGSAVWVGQCNQRNPQVISLLHCIEVVRLHLSVSNWSYQISCTSCAGSLYCHIFLPSET
jgi:hypothetical protein